MAVPLAQVVVVPRVQMATELLPRQQAVEREDQAMLALVVLAVLLPVTLVAMVQNTMPLMALVVVAEVPL